ncbi:hypothetical protein RJ639_039659 [Escallonia herrerae]|uniref:IBB domain-containing protein n=1 Tax=Escallonia herrerae TaxID=1293975 RepID=A0AA89BAP0_9ASTE|nr:hypothetical protein RJ639_039659 [Escallonia herrerae]
MMPLRPKERTEVRWNVYNVTVDAEEGRRQREDNMVEIRKNQREESLQKNAARASRLSSFPFLAKPHLALRASSSYLTL